MASRKKAAAGNTMSLPEWAGYMGWASAGMAYQARDEGRVVLAPDGKSVLAAESKARYMATADPAKSAVADRHAQGRAGDGDGDEPATEDDGTLPGYDYQSARARREHWAAAREEMVARKEAGELIDVAEHVAAFANMGATIRAALEGWAAMLAPQLAGRDEQAIRTAVADQVEQVLREISTQIKREAARTEGARA